MKQTIYIIISLLISFPALATNNTDTTTVDKVSEAVLTDDAKDEAIVAYNEGNYRKSIELLEEEIKVKKAENLESAILYYNLGNAYFRINELGHARLNYEKAALLDPSDRDIAHNIDYLSTRIEDKIAAKDSVFLTTWFNAVQNVFNANTWAILGVIFFLLFISCLFLFFFTREVLIKKITFYIGLIVIIFVIFANIFAQSQKQKLVHRDTAVVVSPSVSILTSPDINSKELFKLHSGTKVNITKDDRNWLEIEIDDGSVGWIQRNNIEII